MGGPINWLIRVRRIEDGFFLAHDEPPAQRGSPFAWRSVPGMPATTQFCRLEVEVEGVGSAGAEIWVVGTALSTGKGQPPTGAKSFDQAHLVRVRAALAAALPEATLCFTTEDREGFTRLIGDPEREPAIAAAVAVAKYYGSWDESDPIAVIVNDDAFAVSVGFSGDDYYRATVRRES